MKKLFFVRVETSGANVRTGFRIRAANHTAAIEAAKRIAAKSGYSVRVLSCGELE